MNEELTKLGLSKYEIGCYLTLLKFGDMKGNDIAVKADIPRTSTYPTLERLENKKFIYPVQDNPKIYRAIVPKLAIESFIDRKTKELERDALRAIEKLENVEVIEKKESVQLLFGKEQSHRSALKTQKTIKDEYFVMGNGLSKVSLRKFFSSWRQMLERGVELYAIMPEKNKEEALKYITRLKSLGANIGFYDNLNNLSFTISDNKRVNLQ